jgi:excisionase family DNA binding protein
MLPVPTIDDNEKSHLKLAPVIPFKERPTCSITEAAAATGLSRSYLYKKISSGELRTKHIGSRNLVLVPSLLALVS